MTCVSCGCKEIEEGDHRCPRCGRRLDQTITRTTERPVPPPRVSTAPQPPPPPSLPPLIPPSGRGAQATAFAPEWKQEISDRLEQFRHRRAQRRPQEPDLFSEAEASEEVPRPDSSQKVLAFEDFAAGRIEPLIIEPGAIERPKSEPPQATPPEWRKDSSRELPAQTELRQKSELPEQPERRGSKNEPPSVQRSSHPALAASRARTLEERAIASQNEFEADESPYDGASPYQVAPIALRGIAGALDCAVALVAVGVFFFTFHLMGGSLHLTQKAWAGTGLAAAAVLASYFFLYTAYGCETPGLQWMGLRVLDYDGSPPNAGQRLMRAVGMLLGAGAVGLGYLWALADEEALTWHDRMSKTFVAIDPTFERRTRRPNRLPQDRL